MPFDRETLGPHLRRERERRGVTLDQIAERTKIKRSLLAALERGDVSAWPGGLYRRAFFRAYADAIGLDSTALAALIGEFVRLFPDPESPDHRGDLPAAQPLRLTLADDAALQGRRTWKIMAVCVDTIGIVGVGLMAAAFIGHPGATIAAVALLYHAVVTIRSEARAVAAPRSETSEEPVVAIRSEQPVAVRGPAPLRPRLARRGVERPIVHSAHNAIG